MDRDSRAFVYASLVYLAVGAVLGMLQAFNAYWVAPLRFSHVHLLLLGFMTMMVCGVGYFILPRFASSTLVWPSLVRVHFWIANVSLVVLVVAKPIGQAMASPFVTAWFYAAAVVQVLAIFLFVANLGGTLLRAGAAARKTAAPTPKPATAPSPPPAPVRSSPGLNVLGPRTPASPPLGPETAVAEFVDRKEGALELLIEAGLAPLRDPAHLEMVRRVGVTLSHACERHGIVLQSLLASLVALPDRTDRPSSPTPTVVAGSGPVVIAPDLVIGTMVDAHPETREVLRRRFGEGCFTCPGFSTETLTQGALMHGVDVDELVRELTACLGNRVP